MIDGVVEIDEEESTTYFNPTFVQKSDHIDVNVFSLTKDVELVITDLQENVLYQAEFDSPMSVDKRFDISALEIFLPLSVSRSFTGLGIPQTTLF